MEPIKIDATKKTPMVKLDSSAGRIDIKGMSIPEDSVEFYRPLLDWLDKYKVSPQKSTEVHIQLEYFNTSSSKSLHEIFRRVETIQKADHEVVVNWYYREDDEDVLEAGEDYQSTCKVPFKMIEVPK